MEFRVWILSRTSLVKPGEGDCFVVAARTEAAARRCAKTYRGAEPAEEWDRACCQLVEGVSYTRAGPVQLHYKTVCSHE